MPLIDILLGSKELKRTIVQRSYDFAIPLKMLCSEANIDYKIFMSSYINSLDSDKAEITEDQFKKLMSLLGIEIRYQFVIDKSFDHESVRQMLVDKENEKKGIVTKIG